MKRFLLLISDDLLPPLRRGAGGDFSALAPAEIPLNPPLQRGTSGAASASGSWSPIRFLLLFLAVVPVTAHAESVTSLARCSTAVFTEISRTGKWSGKAPAGCPPQVAVEQEPSGLAVTVWGVQQGREHWVETAFSAVMDYSEMARPKELARASKEIMARAKRLERCLESLKTANDPLDCKRKGAREYLVGEESGVEDRDSIWLDDGGRGCVVQYAVGDTAATPTPPLSFSEGQPLPPGVDVEIFLKNGRRGRR